MRLTPFLVSIPFVVLLLTWLLFKGMNTDSQRFERAVGILDNYELAESALHRDVLAARVGILRNYDSVVAEIRVQQDALQQLREVTASDAEEMATVDRLDVLLTDQAVLIDRFKTSNALLQNSLAYFVQFSARLSVTNRQNGAFISPLVAAMLNFTLNTSPAVAQTVEDRLNDVARQTVAPEDAEAVETLLAHGRLLHSVLPATDDVLRRFFAVPSEREEETMRTLLVDRHNDARRLAREYRLLLYVTSIALLIGLIYFGFRLRSRAHALRRFAAFEHLLAGMSTGFINCRPEDIDIHLGQALGMLSEHIGADRGYYIGAGRKLQIHTWHRSGDDFPANWQNEVLALSGRLATGTEDIFYFPSAADFPAGPTGDAIRTSSLSGWVCIVRTADDGTYSLLGFDMLRAAPAIRPSELGLLRMALDALSNAVGRITLEEERTRLEARLQQAGRMETLGSFASGIAHNFNNIIAAILGYTEIAEGKLIANDQVAGHLTEIRLAGERARDLVEQILAFGRRREGRSRPVDVAQLTRETVSLLQVSLPGSIDLAVRLVPEGAVVIGEPEQLQQIIINLCNNAAQAMDGTGRVEIAVHVHQIEAPLVLTHGNINTGRYVSIAVNDTGYGMTEATMERLFEPFFTMRSSGNGLGLATVLEIIRQHGGAMNVRSSIGIGSQFEAWLPCMAVQMTAPSNEATLLPLGQGETLLIIGEDRQRLLGDEEVLAAIGYEPRSFARIDDALAACRENPTGFDALILSHFSSLPAAIGVARKFRQLVRDLPILLTLPALQEIDTSLLISSGISEVVRQPLNSAEMAAALRRCLRGNLLSNREASAASGDTDYL